MIDPKELRIGSIIDTVNRRGTVHLPNNHPLKVVTIGVTVVMVVGIDQVPAKVEKWHEVEMHNVLPIPLSVEWLERFGFELNEKSTMDAWVYRRSSFHIFKFKGIGANAPFLIQWGLYSDTRTVVRYVHQLQNLYLSLTGTELQQQPTPHEQQA